MLKRYRDAGFTLIELIVVMAVLAIVAFVAVPSFQQVIENNRTTSQANRLLASINFARSEAVKIGDVVTLTPSGNDFSNGWCVHLGAACNGADIIRQFEGADLAFNPSENQVSFTARGERTPQANANLTIVIEPTDCDAGEVDKQRVISISLSGRSSISREDC